MKAAWERINSNFGRLRRLEVPGGWLVFIYFTAYERFGGRNKTSGSGLVFYPDPEHLWTFSRKIKPKRPSERIDAPHQSN